MKTRIPFMVISLIAICPLIFSSCNNNKAAEEPIAEDQLAVTTLTVSGFTCGGCKAKLEGELLAHNIKAEVDTQKATDNTVVRHPKNISVAEIKKLIVAAGYKVESEEQSPKNPPVDASEPNPVSPLVETIVTVSGLTCGSCKADLERKLLEHGIKAEIDMKKTKDNAVLKHEKNITLADIKKIISAAGYQLEN